MNCLISCQLKSSPVGEFCEVRMEIPCPDKFFGASSIGVCGPCQCAIGMNLSPVCNKSTGECYCNVSAGTNKFRDFLLQEFLAKQ